MAAGEPRLPRRQCASMQCFYRLCDEDPGFRARNARLEDVTSRRIATGRIVERRVRVIPVVVHVVWNKTSENISMAQLRSQISVLNRDFRARNRDRSKVPDVWKPIVGDSRVEFELAKKDPAGKPTNGVVRVETDQTSFDSNDSVKFRGSGGSNAWPASRYLNLWVCTLRGGLLGYAQFPGGPKRTDGVVIRNTAFGTTGTAAAPFDKGRTATHEIGHFFNLRHEENLRQEASEAVASGSQGGVCILRLCARGSGATCSPTGRIRTPRGWDLRRDRLRGDGQTRGEPRHLDSGCRGVANPTAGGRRRTEDPNRRVHGRATRGRGVGTTGPRPGFVFG